MKTISTLKITCLLLLVSVFSFAQVKDNSGRKVFGKTIQGVNPSNGLIRCVSTEYEESLQEKLSNRATTEEFETWIAPKVEAIKQRMLSAKNTNTVVTIPVVVHVIHNGDAIGVNENISDARVLSQITVLNEDFRRMLDTPGYNSNAVGADIEIEFCMAQVDPDGNTTTGIDRVNLGVASWATESSVEGTLKAQTSWDPTQYFNIWVCQFSTSQTAELAGILGYAQFPSDSGLGGLNTDGGDADTDGVIIDYRCFGSSDYVTGSYYTDYDKGRTATHEIGHCFGLRHIWGDNSSCTVNATDSNKDYCLDTPAASTENYDCLSVYNSCTLATGNDMTENYMDYTNDTCMNTFTLDQKARIWAVIENSPRRSTLPTSTVCQETLGTSSYELLNTLSVYPNPVNDKLNISLGSASDFPDAYSIYNSLGQVVLAKTINSSSDLVVDTYSFSAGIYFIRIQEGSAFKTLKFLKK